MKKIGRKSKAQVQRGRRIAQHRHVALDLSSKLSGTLSEGLLRAGTAAGALTLITALNAQPAHAATVLPTGASFAGGTAGSWATISTSGSTMTFTQGGPSGSKLIINWLTYNIGSGATVNYIQPSSTSIVLNRVTGGSLSDISGQLNANGQVWLINPAGIVFHNGASINTGSFLASTLNINDSDFLSGYYKFTGTPGSLTTITNSGIISAAGGGYVALMAPTVSNTGTIIATTGKIHLASGDQMTLNFNGNDLIGIAVDASSAAGAMGISNSGLIAADGGVVTMTAKNASALLKNVVNNTGVVEAKGISGSNGSIYLDGGNQGVANSGTLDVSGQRCCRRGGAALRPAGYLKRRVKRPVLRRPFRSDSGREHQPGWRHHRRRCPLHELQ